jgi:hypothetical protein
MVSYADVAAIAGGSLGSSSFLENPAFAIDQYNGYDLLVSMGTWNKPGSYKEIEMACIGRNGTCVPSRGGVINLAPPGSVTNAAGASFMSDDGRSGALTVFHGSPSGAATPRYVFAVSMSSVNANGT